MKRRHGATLAGWDPNTKDAEVEVEQDPLTGGCYKAACASTERAWIGLRGRPGVVSGQYCFEVKVTEGLLRVGWSSSTASLALGTDAEGFGFGGTGKKSHRNKFADYGAAFEAGDVVTCCLDRDRREVSFGVNGIWYGKAFDIPKAWDDFALFPAICAREAFRITGYFGCPDHPKVPHGCDFWPLGAAYPEDVVESAAGPPMQLELPGLEESAETRGARRGRFAKMARVDQVAEPDCFDAGVLIGRCRALERGYLRDAAKLRDPEQIRPMPVLREALQHCLSAGRAWSWEAEMLRAIRQDITVQHLDADFLEEVCEVSCLRALANGDWAVFASCSSTLKRRPRAAELRWLALLGRPQVLAAALQAMPLEDTVSGFVRKTLADLSVGLWTRALKRKAPTQTAQQAFDIAVKPTAKAQLLCAICKAFPTAQQPTLQSLGVDSLPSSVSLTDNLLNGKEALLAAQEVLQVAQRPQQREDHRTLESNLGSDEQTPSKLHDGRAFHGFCVRDGALSGVHLRLGVPPLSHPGALPSTCFGKRAAAWRSKERKTFGEAEVRERKAFSMKWDPDRGYGAESSFRATLGLPWADGTFVCMARKIPIWPWRQQNSALFHSSCLKSVPNLFNAEDKTQILEVSTSAAQAAGCSDPAEVFAFFTEQCRKNLHLVLALSPIGEAFRRRVRMFPAIVNCCTIDWFMEWPEEALRGVATHFLQKVDLAKDVFTGVVEICVRMQESVFELTDRFRREVQRHYYVTPTSYLELINSFKGVLASKRDDVSGAKRRYDDGLEKVISTEEQVKTMSIQLEELRPVLKQTSAETADLMTVIEHKQEEASATQAVVAKEEEAASQQAEASRTMKEECQADLDKALPALNAALDALKSLKKGAYLQVKNMKSPPEGVITVSKALCWMFDVKPKKVTAEDGRTKIDDYWEPSKKSLWGVRDSKMLDRLLGYDKDHIPVEVIEKLKPLEDDPEFDPEVIKKASTAAMGICKWVRAMIVYDGVAKVVGPKKEALAQAESELAKASTNSALWGRRCAMEPYDESCINIISLETGNAIKSITVRHIGNAAAILSGISEISTCCAEGPCIIKKGSFGFSVELSPVPEVTGQQVWQSFSEPLRGISDWRLSVRSMESGLQPVLERNQDGVHVHLGSAVGSVEDGWFAFASWTGEKTIEVTILSKLGKEIGRLEAYTWRRSSSDPSVFSMHAHRDILVLRSTFDWGHICASLDVYKIDAEHCQVIPVPIEYRQENIECISCSPTHCLLTWEYEIFAYELGPNFWNSQRVVIPMSPGRGRTKGAHFLQDQAHILLSTARFPDYYFGREDDVTLSVIEWSAAGRLFPFQVVLAGQLDGGVRACNLRRADCRGLEGLDLPESSIVAGWSKSIFKR
ncbi:DNAH7 [Symbiodinium sp. KB8]|nr:DNAH7 [Symbiodinium sp. KB8]